MKNSIVKQLTLTFFSLLISSMTWAQSLSGAGTSSNPYKITNADDWKTFGQWINDGKYNDKYYKLTADIGTANNPIRTMVGIWSEKEEDRRPFKGYFYGENHTITIDYEQNPDGKYTAPFVYTDGATINKIRIAGKINVEVASSEWQMALKTRKSMALTVSSQWILQAATTAEALPLMALSCQ